MAHRFGTRKDGRVYPKIGEVIPESVLQNALAHAELEEEKYEGIWRSLKRAGLTNRQAADKLACESIAGLMRVYGISEDTARHIHATAKITKQYYDRPESAGRGREEARRIRAQYAAQGADPDKSGYADPDKHPEAYE